MSPSSGKIVIVASAGTGLLVALPTILTWLANIGVRRIPGYRGRVKRVRIDFSSPRLVIQGISLAKFNRNKPEQILHVGSVVIASRWKNILAGTIDGYIRIDSPRLLLDLGEMHRQAEDATPNGNYQQPRREQQPWQERVNQLPAFRLSSAVVADGVELLTVKTLGPSHPDAGYAKTRAFYAACGFLPVVELLDLWPGNPCLIMAKPLRQRYLH